MSAFDLQWANEQAERDKMSPAERLVDDEQKRRERLERERRSQSGGWG